MLRRIDRLLIVVCVALAALWLFTVGWWIAYGTQLKTPLNAISLHVVEDTPYRCVVASGIGGVGIWCQDRSDRR